MKKLFLATLFCLISLFGLAQSFTGVTASGTDTYAITVSGSSYFTNQSFEVRFTNPNTGAATLAVTANGVVQAAKAITTDGSTPVTAGQLNGVKWLSYNGTNFQIVNNSSGSGTVSTVSVVSANGLAGTVANPTTTPAITFSTTVTGLVKGNGTSFSAAVAGTDYQAPMPTAGGDLSGTYPNPGVAKILGNTVPSNAAGILSNDGLGNLTWDISLSLKLDKITINELIPSGNYTLVLADAYKLKESNTVGANNITVPPHSSVAFDVGTFIQLSQYNTGISTLVAGSGVTIHGSAGDLLIHGTQYGPATLFQRATNEWYLWNGLQGVPVTEANLSFSDITTANVTSTLHGLAPKSPADATKFLNGATTPAYASVKDSDLSFTDITTNNFSTTKHGYVPKGTNVGNFLKDDGTWSSAAGWGLSGTSSFTGAVSIDQTTTSGNTLKFLTPTLGVTSVDGKGLWIQNTTAAAAGAQQISGGVLWEGQGWATTPVNSQSVKIMADVLPVQGTANPIGAWRLRASVNGGAYAEAARFLSTGEFLLGYTALATTEILGARKDQNVGTTQALINATSGTGAFTQFMVSSSSTLASGLSLRSFSAGYTTSTMNIASIAQINSNMASGLDIGTSGVSPVLLYTNLTERFRMDGSGNISSGSTASVVYRNTNAGSDVSGHFVIDPASSLTAGIAYTFDATNGFGFTQGNGTRRIQGAGIKPSGLVNTLGAEQMGEDFFTQSGGTAATVKMTLSGAGNLGIGVTPVSKLDVAGSVGLQVTVVSTDLTLDGTYYTVLVDASGANRTITLPAVAGVAKRIYVVKKTDSSANSVTIDGNASETIDGATTKVVNTQYSGWAFQANTAGTAWFITATF